MGITMPDQSEWMLTVAAAEPSLPRQVHLLWVSTPCSSFSRGQAWATLSRTDSPSWEFVHWSVTQTGLRMVGTGVSQRRCPRNVSFLDASCSLAFCPQTPLVSFFSDSISYHHIHPIIFFLRLLFATKELWDSDSEKNILNGNPFSWVISL